MSDAEFTHRADGKEVAYRVWANLLHTGWILASFAYSKKEDAEKYRDRLARRADLAAWRGHEVREEIPKPGLIVIDDGDRLMRESEHGQEA